MLGRWRLPSQSSTCEEVERGSRARRTGASGRHALGRILAHLSVAPGPDQPGAAPAVPDACRGHQMMHGWRPRPSSAPFLRPSPMLRSWEGHQRGNRGQSLAVSAPGPNAVGVGAKLGPNVAGPPRTIRTCRHAEGSSLCWVGFS